MLGFEAKQLHIMLLGFLATILGDETGLIPSMPVGCRGKVSHDDRPLQATWHLVWGLLQSSRRVHFAFWICVDLRPPERQ